MAACQLNAVFCGDASNNHVDHLLHVCRPGMEDFFEDLLGLLQLQEPGFDYRPGLKGPGISSP
jgi:hypothetical protein